MFRAMFSPIIRSTWLYLQYLLVFTQVAAGWQPAATPWRYICNYSFCLFVCLFLLSFAWICHFKPVPWRQIFSFFFLYPLLLTCCTPALTFSYVAFCCLSSCPTHFPTQYMPHTLSFSTKRPTSCACFRLQLLSPLPSYVPRPVSTNITLHCCLSDTWYNSFEVYSTRKTILCGTLTL